MDWFWPGVAIAVTVVLSAWVEHRKEGTITDTYDAEGRDLQSDPETGHFEELTGTRVA